MTKPEIITLCRTRQFTAQDRLFWLALCAVCLLKVFLYTDLRRAVYTVLPEYYAKGPNIFRDVAAPYFRERRENPLGFLFDVFFASRFMQNPGVVVLFSAGILFLTAFLLCRVFELNGRRFGAVGVCVFALAGFGWRSVLHIEGAHTLFGFFLSVMSAYLLSLFISKLINERGGANLFLTLFCITNLASMGFGYQYVYITLMFAGFILAANFTRLTASVRVYIITAVLVNSAAAFAYYVHYTDGGGHIMGALFTLDAERLRLSFELAGIPGFHYIYGEIISVFIVALSAGILLYAMFTEKLFAWRTPFGFTECIGRAAAGVLLMFIGLCFYADSLIILQAGIAVAADAAFDAASYVKFRVKRFNINFKIVKPFAAAAACLLFFSY
jgi:hypothetical protein